MSKPSSWPLPPNSNRYVVPRSLAERLRQHPLSSDLYPLGIGHYVQALGHAMTREDHDDYLLIYCTEGRGALTVGQHHGYLKAGQLVLLPRGLAHTYSADDADPWTIYWVHFEGESADAFFRNLPMDPDYPVIEVGQNAKLIADFENLLQVRRSGYQLRPFLHAANQLRQILSYLALLRSRSTATDSGFDLELIHSYMQSHIHEPLELETLANQVNLSKYHFAKKYKEATGTSAINHFINLKIEHACQLLDVGNQSISQISYALGYDDAYYFSRLFKKVMGISPSQYRGMRLGSWPRRS
ncbi:AraC family transcriptional regulator [Motiliproteus coralliicola]|uniref:AraC family transcriptional regulator n=1 Tax=Motiliproteus coralliicola TaxID=2283196 RepID=A0A369WCU9_9GAMM|nr:AraC family transcriptional regulator [Motiliproteus coralliicola]RDE19457.1 AraC family transcriptional regulator [Motiliproteus coralliicola]